MDNDGFQVKKNKWLIPPSNRSQWRAAFILGHVLFFPLNTDSVPTCPNYYPMALAQNILHVPSYGHNCITISYSFFETPVSTDLIIYLAFYRCSKNLMKILSLKNYSHHYHLIKVGHFNTIKRKCIIL